MILAIWTALLWTSGVVILTEVLSVFKLLYPAILGLAWGGGALILALILWRKGPIKVLPELRSLDNTSKILLGVTVLIALITLLVAFLAPPNNYDSMTYHMSRIMHWTQNHSVGHYQTGILRQLYMPPAAEFVILNFQILLGNDRLANLVQWLSMIGSLLAVYLITQSLGGDKKVRMAAAFIAATLPMGIAQATSTQTDYFAAFWVLCSAYFILKLQADDIRIITLGAGLSFGLAMLSKPTAYIFLLPFGTYFLVIIIRRAGRAFWKPLLIFLLLILSLNLGYYLRNYNLFGSPLGPGNDEVNRAYWPQNIVVNIGKYFVNNFNSPFPVINQMLYSGVNQLSHSLGVNLNDRTTSEFGEFKIEKYTPHEDVIGNPIHLLLIVFALIYYPVFKKPKDQQLKAYLILVASGSLLFFIFIKYQPWLNRLTLPGLALFAPLLGMMIENYFRPSIKNAVYILVVILAIPPLFMNITRPLIPPPFAARSKYSILNTPRENFYFTSMGETRKVYKKAAQLIRKRGYHDIGLVGINNEYPLWVMLHNQPVRLEYVEVNNISSTIKTDFRPDAVLVFGPDKKLSKKMTAQYGPGTSLGKDSFGQELYLYGQGTKT